jgi:hypothetical protein
VRRTGATSYHKFACSITKSRAGIAQSVQCLTTDWTTGVQSPTEAEDFSSSLCVQTGSGAHPASCTMGTGGPFPRGKVWLGRDADHSPPSSAEVNSEYELYLLSLQVPPWRIVGSLYLYLITKSNVRNRNMSQC